MNVNKFDEFQCEGPKKGDYVICHDKNEFYLNDFLEKSIGKIIEINNALTHPYFIKYNNIPKEFNGSFQSKYKQENYLNCRYFAEKEIIYWSNDKEDLDSILQAKKYNL